MLVVIAGFWLLQHQRVPTIAAPANYTMVGKQMRIPVVLGQSSSGQTSFGLARTASGYYVALLYQNGRLSHQFQATVKAAAPTAGTSGAGHTYPATGDIHINGTEYQVAEIHVDASGRAGYIQLKPIGSAPGANAAANSAGNSAAP